MKKIGITCGFLYPDKSRNIYNAKTLSYVENQTIAYAVRAGHTPVILPDIEMENLIPMLNNLDALILHGGSDVAPESYGEKPIGQWEGDKYRDEYELRIIDYAFKNNIPILGICRGCQILNVYFGGTLYQDLPTQVGSKVTHSNSDKYDLNFHKIAFTGDNFLNKLYNGAHNKLVNSIHHQAVKDLGKGLIPLSVSPEDGIVEAFYYEGAPEKVCWGIQWHPEFHDSSDERLLNGEVLLNYFLGTGK